MIDEEGGVIAADSNELARFDSTGVRVWTTSLFGDLPISPVITENGIVVLAVQRSPGSTAESTVYAIDSRNGELVGLLEDASLASFDTVNTPATIGNRVYVSMKNDDAEVSRLQAIDVDPEAAEPLSVGPAFEGFEPPQGASPLAIENRIYFDGAIGDTFYIFAVEDRGDSLELLWRQEVSGRVEASLSRDPRGGVWGFAVGFRFLHRWDELTGEELDRIDLDEIVGVIRDIHVPASAMSIAGDATAPYLLVEARPLVDGDIWVVAVDLASRSLHWRYRYSVAPALCTAPQYPIVNGAEGPVVVFPTCFAGARGVGF